MVTGTKSQLRELEALGDLTDAQRATVDKIVHRERGEARKLGARKLAHQLRFIVGTCGVAVWLASAVIVFNTAYILAQAVLIAVSGLIWTAVIAGVVVLICQEAIPLEES